MGQFRARLTFILIILGLGGLTVIGRLFTIQILENKRYAERSRDQTETRRMLSARRGAILDRNGVVLASSVENAGFIKPVDLGLAPKKTEDQTPIKRVYPFGSATGALLGYVGKDGYGLGGIEYSFDNYLRGEDGWIILQKDGRNQRYTKLGLPSKEAVNGHSVYLTIDNNIQKIAQGVLRQTVASLDAKGGMCIVMEPATGKILAMANEPSFDPNIPSNFTTAQRQNKCVGAVYEPGSTFKVVTAAAALQEKVKKEDDIIYGNNGVFEIYNQTIKDHNPYGYLTFTKALSYSSNVCFAKVAGELGNDRLYKYIRDFGFGLKTEIELPGEESGIVHPIKLWSGRSLVTIAMGQEISVTLLQMLLPFAAVANGGVLVKPVICEKIVSQKNETIDSLKYQPVRRVISEDVASRLRMMLKSVVEDGTGKNARLEGTTVAGKTGTSQKPDSGSYSKTRSWSSFIGFVPAEEPVLLCGVMIDEPAHGEMGGVAAAPAFKKIMSQIISHPELEFAEKILKQSPSQLPKSGKSIVVPQVCGLTKDAAQQKLDSAGIQYTLDGTGEQVTYQVPFAGGMLDAAGKLTIYLDSPGQKTQQMPLCVGKDLRDAVNMVNIKGLKYHVVGSGFVKKQNFAPGSIVHAADVCTLYCAFGG